MVGAIQLGEVFGDSGFVLHVRPSKEQTVPGVADGR